MRELTKHEREVQNASLKYPQTFGVLEHSQGTFKRSTILITNEQWNEWSKYMQLSASIDDASYH